jgi:type I restriction-modification system DNA methylase subunit
MVANNKHSHRIINRDQLDRMLWGAADILRGTTDAADFKNHILSLLLSFCKMRGARAKSAHLR